MRTSGIVLLLLIAVGLGNQAAGTKGETCENASGGACGQTCCDCCGCPCNCLQKTCQLVCETKKETKTCWCVEEQEFCTLMPGCHHDCDDCCQPLPRCGKSKCVKKLVKKEYQVETPVYKCVVRYVCPTCLNGGSASLPNHGTSPRRRTSRATGAASPNASVKSKIAIASHRTSDANSQPVPQSHLCK